MNLTIVFRKEVESVEIATTLTNIVRTRLEDHPDIEITASVGQTIPKPEVPE